ncbi:MAG: hypothetical protein IJH92_02455 [Mogibacterium sp.]|nr:hypothetical protein [Mogibacterium sp.]
MDNTEREALDHEYGEFVYEQVVKYGEMHAKVTKVYLGCAIACVLMGLAGLLLGKSVLSCICVALWSVGFLAAKKYYESAAEEIGEAAAFIRSCIDDPDYDIPDDYPDHILDLRDLVCPTLKNIRSQVVAYGIIAVSCWAGAVVILCAATMEGFSIVLLIASLIMAAMAIALTILTLRAWKAIPLARAYEEYLIRIVTE